MRALIVFVLFFCSSSGFAVSIRMSPSAETSSLGLNEVQRLSLTELQAELYRIELFSHSKMLDYDRSLFLGIDNRLLLSAESELRAADLYRSHLQDRWIEKFTGLTPAERSDALTQLVRLSKQRSHAGVPVAELRLIERLVAEDLVLPLSIQTLLGMPEFMRRENVSLAEVGSDELLKLRQVYERKLAVSSVLFQRIQSQIQLRTDFRPSRGQEGNIIGTEFQKGEFHFTFDDGPHDRSLEVVNALNQYGLKATFFWVGRNMRARQTIIDKIRMGGHAIENHSMSHPNFLNLSAQKRIVEIAATSQEIENQTGTRPVLIRLPYGAGVNNAAVRQTIADQSLVHVFWNIDSLDWQDRNPQSIANRVIAQVEKQGRGIILMHDIHQQTVAALPLILDEMNRRGALDWARQTPKALRDYVRTSSQRN